MKSIILGILWILASLGGTNNNVNTTVPVNTCSKLMQLSDDDEPIPLRGHTHGVGGHVIAGASVELTPDGSSIPLYTDVTDSYGEYYFADVIPGNYTLKLSASGYVTQNIELTISSATERWDTLVSQ